MTNKQHPVGSGFTAASMIDDVIAGIDLTGRNVIVTAGHVGLGLEVTRALAEAGASVVVASRNPETAASATAGIDGVRAGQLNLTDPASIDRFAAGYLGSGRKLHLPINNAGIMGCDLVRDARGYEAHFSTNHLGHFQLTKLLLPALRAAGGARVVQVSSWSHHLSDIRWNDAHFHSEYDWMTAYGQSKTANVLFAVELDRRWADDAIRGYAVHPGTIASTNLGSSLPVAAWQAMGAVDGNGQPIIDPASDMKTPKQGASTHVFAATSPLLADIGGVYLANNDVAPLEPDATPITGNKRAELKGTSPTVTGYAVDLESAQRLWEFSEKLLG